MSIVQQLVGLAASRSPEEDSTKTCVMVNGGWWPKAVAFGELSPKFHIAWTMDSTKKAQPAAEQREKHERNWTQDPVTRVRRWPREGPKSE